MSAYCLPCNREFDSPLDLIDHVRAGCPSAGAEEAGDA